MPNHGDCPVIDQVDILRFRIGYPCPNCARPQVRYIDQLGQVQMCVGCGNPHELPNAILVTAPGPLFPVEPEAESTGVHCTGHVDYAPETRLPAECEHRRQHWNMQGGGHCDDCGAPVGTSVTAAELVASAEPSFYTGGLAPASRLHPGELPVILGECEEHTVFKLDEITPACLEYAQAARKAWGCTENDGFAIEMAYQFGATVIDDDCELLAITRENMVNLMAALGFEHREPSGLRCAGCPPEPEPAAVLDGPVSDPQVAGCSCAACTARFGNWPKGD